MEEEKGCRTNSWLLRSRFSCTSFVLPESMRPLEISCSHPLVSTSSLVESTKKRTTSDDPNPLLTQVESCSRRNHVSKPDRKIIEARPSFFATSHSKRSRTACSEISKNNIKKKRLWARHFDHKGGNNVDATCDWILELSDLWIGKTFARGAHSKLHHGIYKNQPVAVKVIEKSDDENGAMAAKRELEFTREVTLLSRLNHRNVIRLAGACKKPHALFVVTEYLSGGSLRELLQQHHQPLPIPMAILITLDIARGMEYIHSQGIIHRDLKPENLIFDQDFHIKVADFGISCEQTQPSALSEVTGTYRWMAPEVMKHKRYGRKIDVYSFGLVLWEMVTGVIPYPHMTGIQAAMAVTNKNLRPVIPPSCPAPLQALMKQCWNVIPEKRPEFREIVNILEQFQFAIAKDDNLDMCQNLIHELGHKNYRVLNWLEKFMLVHAW